jgi:hypothetical protein
MIRKLLELSVLLVLISACDRRGVDAPAVIAVSPRLVSDQTVYPLVLYGTGFAPGMRIRIEGAGRTETAAVDVVDDAHAIARVRLTGSSARTGRSIACASPRPTARTAGPPFAW